MSALYVGPLNEQCGNCGAGSPIIGAPAKLGVKVGGAALCFTCVSVAKALIDYALGAVATGAAPPLTAKANGTVRRLDI